MGAGKVPWSKGWLQETGAMQVCNPDAQGWSTSAVPGHMWGTSSFWIPLS